MNLVQIGQFILQIQLLVLLVALLTIFIKQGRLSGQHHKLLYAASAFLFAIITVADATLQYFSSTDALFLTGFRDWIHITAITITLSALGLMIRESKPKIARAPFALAFLPFLILAVYPFVADTFVLKRFLFLLLEGGGLLIALLMYALHSIKDSSYRWIAAMIALFGLTSVVNVFSDEWVLFTQLFVLIILFVIYKTYKQRELQF
jgi:hypothetical protein